MFRLLCRYPPSRAACARLSSRLVQRSYGLRNSALVQFLRPRVAVIVPVTGVLWFFRCWQFWEEQRLRVVAPRRWQQVGIALVGFVVLDHGTRGIIDGNQALLGPAAVSDLLTDLH